MRISSGVIQNNSDNPPNLAGTDSNAKGIRGEGENKNCGVFSPGFGAKWDVCPVYHLWEPVRQVCALLLRWFILTPFYWPPLGIRLTSFSWCFCAGLCRRIVALQAFNVQPFVWNGSVKGLGETLLGNEPGASGFSRTSSAPKTTERSENIWKRCGYGYIGALIPATL